MYIFYLLCYLCDSGVFCLLISTVLAGGSRDQSASCTCSEQEPLNICADWIKDCLYHDDVLL